MLTSSILQMELIWYLTAQNRLLALVLSLASMAGLFTLRHIGNGSQGTLVGPGEPKTAMIGADLFAIVRSQSGIGACFRRWRTSHLAGARRACSAEHGNYFSIRLPSARQRPWIVPAEEPTDKVFRLQAQSLQTVGYIAGTAIAGILYPICTISQMVALDNSAMAASLAVALIHIPKPQSGTGGGRGIPLCSERCGEGLAVIRKQRGLYALDVDSGAVYDFVFPINALFPLMSLDCMAAPPSMRPSQKLPFLSECLAGGLLLGKWGGFRTGRRRSSAQ